MAQERVKRRLAAILAADMVGYSRLMEADERGTIARKKAHRNELIDPEIAAYDGRFVKLMGGGTSGTVAAAGDAFPYPVSGSKTISDRTTIDRIRGPGR